MREYPSRVTLFDDGAYRWCYDMDMWRNRFMLCKLLRVMGVVFGAAAVVLAFMLGPSRLTPALIGWLALGVAGMLILALLIYALCALVMHGHCLVRYEMDEDAVALIQTAAAQRRTGALAAVATAAGLAAGQPGAALRTGALIGALDGVGATPYRSIRRVKLRRDCDVIDLWLLFGMNQIYVPPEDYDFVRDFIATHVSERARP